jgi:hypothetical protein
MQYKSNVRSIEHEFDTSRGATMSIATITPVTPATRQVYPVDRRSARLRSARGPVARPARAVPGLDQRLASRADVRSCRVDTVAAGAQWRLTERGITVVLVLALMITVAAVAVIGLTAWQVTGADYASWSVGAVIPR